MHDALAYILNYLQTNWQTIGVYLLGGTGISVIVKGLDKVRKWKHAPIKEIALGIISGLSALADWVIQNYHTSPLAQIGNTGARLYVAAVLMHRILVNPLVKLLEGNVLGTVSNLKNLQADAAAYRASKAEQTQTPSETPWT